MSEKVSIDLAGLRPLFDSFISRIVENRTEPPKNAVLVAKIAPDDKRVSLEWVLPIEQRASVPEHKGLDKIVQCNHIVLAGGSVIYSAMELVRSHLKAANVYICNKREDSVTYGAVYMIPNEKPLLLGVCGEIGVGKTTAVNHLSQSHGMTEYMFAKPLKEIAVTLGFEPHQVFGTQEQKLEVNSFWGISGRQFLQVFGSEVCRDFVPQALPQMNFNGLTMWVRLFEKYMLDHPNTNVAVSDVRFEDESRVINQNGGVIVRIVRNIEDNADVKTYDQSAHKSETNISNVRANVTILNDGSINDLCAKFDKLITLMQDGTVTPETANLVF